MSPREAKVFIAEDDANWQDIHRRSVTRAGHKIIVEVNSYKKAMDAVERALMGGGECGLA